MLRINIATKESDYYINYKPWYGQQLFKAMVTYSPTYDFEGERELVAICKGGDCLHTDNVQAGFLDDVYPRG